MDALSVPETYFWREIDQVRAIVDVIVPALVCALRGAPLRIWSVPCASGEEPLTIAMMLDMAGWFGRAPIEIHASDASPAQVARARAGRYRERSFRALPANLRERYFRADGDAWVPDAALASRITSWSVVNLMDRERVAPLARAPVIFCRNVFIYFSPDGVRDVVNRFADLMPAPGVSVRRRFGIAAARHEPVHARRDRRRLRVRQTVTAAVQTAMSQADATDGLNIRK